MNRKKRTRVLIIVENLPVPLDRRVWQEALSLRKAGYRVAVLCPRMKGYSKGRERMEGIDIYRHPMPREARGALQYIVEYLTALFWETVYAFRIFVTTGFDIIQVCNPPDLLFLVAWPYKLLAGVRLVFDFHDSSPEVWAAKGGGRKGLFPSFLRFFERLSIKAADVVMTVNEPYRLMVARRGGLSADSVYVVRNSPRIPEAVGLPVRTRRDGMTIVGYIGVMGKQDGVENLIDMLDYLVRERGRKDILLKLMGTGPEFASIQSRIKALGLTEHAVMTGWVSGREYVEHLQACDICVNADIVNSYNNLCSPNKIYEYMYFAKPIVQFPMAENSFQAQGACLFASPNDYRDLGDKILSLADDSELRERLGKRGKERFHELFTWERSEERLLQAYSSASR